MQNSSLGRVRRSDTHGVRGLAPAAQIGALGLSFANRAPGASPVTLVLTHARPRVRTRGSDWCAGIVVCERSTGRKPGDIVSTHARPRARTRGSDWCAGIVVHEQSTGRKPGDIGVDARASAGLRQIGYLSVGRPLEPLAPTVISASGPVEIVISWFLESFNIDERPPRSMFT